MTAISVPDDAFAASTTRPNGWAFRAASSSLARPSAGLKAWMTTAPQTPSTARSPDSTPITSSPTLPLRPWRQAIR
jgi:hypothetical protein